MSPPPPPRTRCPTRKRQISAHVVEEATEAVEEATGSVGVEAIVADAKDAVDEAVADPAGTAAERRRTGEE